MRHGLFSEPLKFPSEEKVEMNATQKWLLDDLIDGFIITKFEEIIKSCTTASAKRIVLSYIKYAAVLSVDEFKGVFSRAFEDHPQRLKLRTYFEELNRLCAGSEEVDKNKFLKSINDPRLDSSMTPDKAKKMFAFVLTEKIEEMLQKSGIEFRSPDVHHQMIQ
ncbi:MAG: hypothetical protein A3F17_09100 [Gammaproteobacteria bacterium RIFCSPHIGHO2_12_FULL_41_15]|nr:MAG: hypothetical protein A3F17_09100 [Gammaproteobacteria bacterium RIFCSPHIGHO2_12_FULL_41_15]